MPPEKSCIPHWRNKSRRERKEGTGGRTVDQVAVGEQQPETEHNFKGEETEADVHRNGHWRHWRQARGWFGYDLTDAQNGRNICE